MTAYLLAHTDATVRIYSRDELKQAQMRERFGEERIRYFLGDVRDALRLRMALRGVTHVFHAAALKHVDAGEYNPDEFVKTNINGTQNLIYESIGENVQRVILLSTDKCVSPVNLYGSTKAVAEKLMIRANGWSPHGTEFAVVRYGNVTGSRGSVVPYWRTQLVESKPLRLTDAKMTRFWITLDEAVQAAWFTMHTAPRGVIVVPNLPAYGLTDLACAMSWADYPLEIVGIRPGEKVHETLMTPEEMQRSALIGASLCIMPIAPSWGDMPLDASIRFPWRTETAPIAYESGSWAWRLDANALRQLLANEGI